MGSLTLKPEQDGMGYFYGQYVTADGEPVRVDVLPPLSHPRPSFVVSTEGRHETDWIIFADGEEVGRVKEQAAIEATLATVALPKG
jgi:hypothetical protein